MNSSGTSALDLLAQNRPSDVSGSSAANRFQFQLSWAICRILELHATGASYALLLDYFDDVVELDDEISPDQLDFYQIKSKKNGTWTLHALTKRSKGAKSEKPSILGKLVRHRQVFPHNARFTSFVSNRPSNLPLSGNKKPHEIEQFTLADTDSETRTAICASVRDECGVEIDESAAEQVRFMTTVLTELDHDNQCRGRMAAFVESHLGEDARFAPVYRTLRSELERRNNEERLPTSARDLVSKKLFARSHMDQLLGLAKPRELITEQLHSIRDSLASEGLEFSERMKLIHACEQLLAERADPTNLLLLDAERAVRTAADKWLRESPKHGCRLLDAIAFVRDIIDPSVVTDVESLYSPFLFNALVVVACHEQQQLSTASEEPSEETT